MSPRWLLPALLLLVSAGSVPKPPEEVASELGDLWRERDAFYLRVDNRRPTTPGEAPKGTKELTVRTEAMSRGRPWPGRWTVLEVEVKLATEQVFSVGFTKQPMVDVRLKPDRWIPLRIPVVEAPADLLLRPQGTLQGKMEFRRVRLVDDRWIIWDDGWTVIREAALIRFKREKGDEIRLPAADVEIEEIGRLRARFEVEGRRATLYASGRLASEPGLTLGETNSEGKIAIEIDPDQGRILRNSAGDADADGYNEVRGATILKVNGKHIQLTLSPTSNTSPTPVHHPAIEMIGLPDGPTTVLWDGSVVKSTSRLEDGTLIIEIPGVVSAASRLEISVGN